jgi:hypothetical protein
MKYEQLLPNMNLDHGEVVRFSDGSTVHRDLLPVKGSVTCDIYEGRYLGKGKVALKVIRSFVSSPKTFQVH